MRDSEHRTLAIRILQVQKTSYREGLSCIVTECFRGGDCGAANLLHPRGSPDPFCKAPNVIEPVCLEIYSPMKRTLSGTAWYSMLLGSEVLWFEMFQLSSQFLGPWIVTARVSHKTKKSPPKKVAQE